VLQRALGLSRSSAEAHLREIESSTIAIAFLGTPSFGADLAPLAESVAKLMKYFKHANVNILATLKRNSETLADTRKDFHNILRLRQQDVNAISITCFFEELPLPVVGEVCHAAPTFRLPSLLKTT
jgi:hypothetical protein